VDHDVWLRRPLPEKNLAYASRDIHHIWLLHENFKQKGYLDDQLLEQSARYLSLWKDAKPRKMDEFRSHALLPLHVIDHDRGGLLQICMGCQRGFTKEAYSKSGCKVASKRYCWVCLPIKIRKHMHDVWARDNDGDDDSNGYGWDMSDDGYSSF
jgi:exonuclease 3'-5' domain-containing protein 1